MRARHYTRIEIAFKTGEQTVNHVIDEGDRAEKINNETEM